MAFDTTLDEAFRTVGRGIAAARVAGDEDSGLPTIDIAPEVAPLSDAQRARMIEVLGRQLQSDAGARDEQWSIGGVAPRFPRH